MKNVNIIEDLGILSNIPKQTLINLVKKAELAAGHAVYEANITHEPVLALNIGIGLLYLNLSADTLEYKFIPNNRFENMLIDVLQNSTDPLTEKIEESLQTRINNIYKELF